MPGYKPMPRPAGGFRPGFDQFDESHLDEQAVQAALQQHQQTQQSVNPAQATTGGSALQAAGQEAPRPPVKPREVGTLAEELFTRPLQDIKQELTQFTNLNALMEINPQDSQEDQAKKQAIHQRWNQLTQDQQQVAQKLYQESMAKKKHQEEEEMQKRQQAEAEQAQSLDVPSSPQKGPQGPAGSKKQKTTQLISQNRQTIGKLQSSG